MLTTWFLTGAGIATVITLVLYLVARWLDSIGAYIGMVILPVIANIVVWAILHFLLDVTLWYLAGAMLAIGTAFIFGIMFRFLAPNWAYLFVFIMPLVFSVIGWLVISIFMKMWGVCNV